MLITWFVFFFVGTLFVSFLGSPGEIGMVKTIAGVFLFVLCSGQLGVQGAKRKVGTKPKITNHRLKAFFGGCVCDQTL